MKVISLNAWRGQIPQIKDFILDNLSSTDIFSFQEAGDDENHLFCQKYLSPDFQVFHCQKRFNPTDIMVQATFVKKNISVIQTQIIGQGQDNLGLALLTQVKDQNNHLFNICNVHGFAWPGDKQDNTDRLYQSQLIIDSLKKIDGPKIITGDFNLDFDTKSVQMFETNGYQNLIKEFRIGNTRNRLSWEPYPTKQYFADFLFLSPDLKVKYFSVPYIEISDHLPLILEVNY